jgi:hypothetical protein
MPLMLIVFLLTLLGINIFLFLVQPSYWLIMAIYWNASNFMYLFLNIVLLIIINF